MRKVFSIRVGAFLLWLLAVGVGFAVILKYETAKGEFGLTPDHWPDGTTLSLDHEHDTLVMFAHPQCPCTRASMGELNRLMARDDGKVAVQVVFFKPAGFPKDWTHGGLWRSAESIPGVQVREDPDGTQARLFGAQTSGCVLLYDPRGKLLFKGGITGSRGHAGDNAGESAVLSLARGETMSFVQTSVYGCSLLGHCEVPPETTNQ